MVKKKKTTLQVKDKSRNRLASVVGKSCGLLSVDRAVILLVLGMKTERKNTRTMKILPKLKMNGKSKRMKMTNLIWRMSNPPTVVNSSSVQQGEAQKLQRIPK